VCSQPLVTLVRRRQCLLSTVFPVLREGEAVNILNVGDVQRLSVCAGTAYSPVPKYDNNETYNDSGGKAPHVLNAVLE
jgi:hypothetical protein